MKACANPKCPFHFEVSNDVLRSGHLHFRPLDVIKPPGTPHTPRTAPMLTGSIDLHLYQGPFIESPRFFLCEVCNEAVRMILR